MNLFGPQVHDRGFDFRFILHAQQFDAVEIDLRNISGAESVAADIDDLVVVVQVSLGQIEHGLGLERCHECGTQIEHHGALQILMLRLRNARAFLRAFETQFALVVAFVQVADVGCS